MLLNFIFSSRLFKGVDLFNLMHNAPDYLIPCRLCYHGKVTDNKRQDPSPTKVWYPALATPYTEVYENMQDYDNPLHRRKQSGHTRFLQLCSKQSSVPSTQMPLWSVRLPIRPWLLQPICQNRGWKSTIQDLSCEMRSVWTHSRSPFVFNGSLFPDIIPRSPSDNHCS